MAYHWQPRLVPAMPDFQRFDSSNCSFPIPRVPLLPTLHWRDLTFSKPCQFPESSVHYFARGRYAMHSAYQTAGVGPSGALLAPAYHCRTMLDPALALHSPVYLYALNPDLTPQLTSIKALVATSQPRVKVLVVPHYFGFEQPKALMAELMAFCGQNGITLVEDCSHAWQLAVKRVEECPPKAGHVLIGSPYKFFACEDGGALWGDPKELALLSQRPPTLIAELKALARTFQKSWKNHNSAGLTLPEKRLVSEHINLGENIKKYDSSPSRMYADSSEIDSNFAVSRWAMRHTPVARVVQQRQHNYHQWVKATAPLSGARSIFPDLPPHCAPYMFPLLIEQPEQHFYQLKHLGVPIWRWDEMAVSDCPVSSQYRLGLLHLPCHQSLSPEQMQWMTASVAEVLT